jgi:transposase
MRTVLPTIVESAEVLRNRFKAESNIARRQRLQVLWLIADGQARSRQQAADMVGVHRNSVCDWLTLYANGGLERLLSLYKPAGKPSPLTPSEMQRVATHLSQSDGEQGYIGLQRWIKKNLNKDLPYHAVYRLGAVKLGASLKVPRPSHIKKSR